MVIKQPNIFRPAIAMIELIFSIVIMGIVLLSAPMLISQSAKSNTVILQQESISMLAAHTNALMTYFWDETNVNNPNLILEVSSSGDSDLAPDPTVLPANPNRLYRDASIGFPLARQRQFSNVTLLSASATLGLDSNSSGSTGTNDVDDFINSSAQLFEQGAANTVSKYIDDKIFIDTVVLYGTDTAHYASNDFSFSSPFGTSVGTSNVKIITSTLKTNETADELKNKTIVMYAFMCNIGGARPLTRNGQ